MKGVGALLFAAALCGLVCVAHAQTQAWVWNGGTMNFGDAKNWANGLSPSNNTVAVCSTTFGGPNKNIISTLGANTYFVGRKLIFPRAGGLRLATTGSAVVFSAAPMAWNDTASNPCDSPDSVNYVWTGGLQYEERNDFYCHKNWLKTGKATVKVPCVSDDVYIGGEDTFQLSVVSSTDVKLVAFRSFQYGSTLSVTSATSAIPATLLPLAVNGFDFLSTTANVVINSNPNSVFDNYCKPLNYYVTYPATDSSEAVSACQCYSSCPTPAMLLAQQINIRDNIQSEFKSLPTSFPVVPFSGSFSAASLFIPADVPLSGVFNKSVLLPALQAAASSIPGFTLSVTNMALSANGNSIVVTGVAYNFSFTALPAGASTTVAPTLLVLNLNSTSPSVNASRLVGALQVALAPLLQPPVAAYLSDILANLQKQLPPSATALLDNLTSVADNSGLTPTVLLNTSNNDPCFSTCTTDCAACADSLQATLINAGVDNATAANLANSFITTKSENPTNWNNITSQINNVVQQTQAVDNQKNATSVLTTVVKKYLTSQPAFFGRTMTVSDQLLAVSPQNINNLTKVVSNALQGTKLFDSVDSVNLTWVSTIPGGSNRRRSAPAASNVLTASALQLIFSYSVSCSANDPACSQPFSPNSPAFASILNLISNAAQALSLLLPPCIISSGPLTGQPNPVCMNISGSAFCSNLVSLGMDTTSARASTFNFLYNLTRCGGQPAYPDGTCVDTSQLQNAQNVAQTISQVTTCAVPTPSPPVSPPSPPSPPSSPGNGAGGSSGSGSGAASTADGGGGGGGGLGIIAGAAGGGAAIAILVAFLLWRRRKNNATGSSQRKGSAIDRTVVAFENPMYDDPSMNPQNTYEASHGGGHHDSDGLYDEPAFSGSNLKKSNPMYQSNEDITGGGGDGGDGYLDVSAKAGAEDVGYLDQGDNGGAEDMGYIEQKGTPLPHQASYDNREAEPTYNNDDVEPTYGQAASNYEDPGEEILAE